MVKQDLKIQWEIHFLTFLTLNTYQNAIFFYNFNYIELSKKSAFGINFGLQEVLEVKMLIHDVARNKSIGSECVLNCVFYLHCKIMPAIAFGSIHPGQRMTHETWSYFCRC